MGQMPPQTFWTEPNVLQGHLQPFSVISPSAFSTSIPQSSVFRTDRLTALSYIQWSTSTTTDFLSGRQLRITVVQFFLIQFPSYLVFERGTSCTFLYEANQCFLSINTPFKIATIDSSFLIIMCNFLCSHVQSNSSDGIYLCSSLLLCTFLLAEFLDYSILI